MTHLTPRRWLPIAGLLAALLVFANLREDLFEGEGLIRFDLPVAHWFEFTRTPAMDSLGMLVAKLTAPSLVALAAIVVSTLLLWRGWRREAAGLALAAVSSSLVAAVLKVLTARPRPGAPINLAPESEGSFPSGHVLVLGTVLLTALVLAWPHLSRGLRAIAVIVVAAGLLLVSIDRLLVGAHWLSDVIASLALAVALAIGSVAASGWMAPRLDALKIPGTRAVSGADSGP